MRSRTESAAAKPLPRLLVKVTYCTIFEASAVKPKGKAQYILSQFLEEETFRMLVSRPN